MLSMVSVVAWVAIFFTAGLGLACTWAAPTRQVYWTAVASTTAMVMLANVEWRGWAIVAVSTIGIVVLGGGVLMLRRFARVQ